MYLLLIDLVFLVLFFSAMLSIFRIWHWLRGSQYNRSAIIVDTYLIFSAWIYSVVATTILPTIELMCFTIGQQELSLAFSVLPILFVTIGCLGVFRSIQKADKQIFKTSFATIFLGMLGLAIIRTIRRLVPCQEPENVVQFDIALISIESIGLTIGIIAGLITIIGTLLKIIISFRV